MPFRGRTFFLFALLALLRCTPGALSQAASPEVLTMETLFLLLPRGGPAPDCSQAMRSIFLIGGVGNGNQITTQVEMFDPETDTIRRAVTLPTARLFFGAVSYNKKIYIMGGQDATGTALTTVEEYDPCSGSVRLMAVMPQRLQGFVAGVSGDQIYLLSGSTTSSMQTGTLFNNVYRFSPSSGASGNWTTLTSNNAIVANIDMAGCTINGTLFFSTGRFYNDGTTQFTSDGYVIGSNTTTSLTEASFTQARYGAAGICYRPQASDPSPDDPAALMLVGGSTLANLSQPPTAIIASSVFDYYKAAPSFPDPNVVTAGVSLPAARYSPAAEISYNRRRLYVFGGASAVNVPTDTIYSVDLANPTASPWQTHGTRLLLPRFGHRAVIINR